MPAADVHVADDSDVIGTLARTLADVERMSPGASRCRRSGKGRRSRASKTRRVLCGPLPDRPLLAALGDFGQGVIDLTAASAEPFDLDTARKGGIAVVTFTSGSTGKPKGVSWSFEVRNKVASVQLSRKVRPANLLVTAPLTHTSGGVRAGQATRHRARRPVERDGTVLHRGPASPERMGEAAKVLGPVLIQVYGTSEAGMISMLFPPEHLDPELRMPVGRPADGVRVTIRDPWDGRALPAGEHGEVWVMTPWSMADYWNEPEPTADAVRDGWVRTGDLGAG